MQKLFNSQISQFSFFEFIGVLTCGTVLSNYFLDKPLINISVHDKFHRTLILSGFCFLKIAKISLNSSFFPKPIKR